MNTRAQNAPSFFKKGDKMRSLYLLGLLVLLLAAACRQAEETHPSVAKKEILAVLNESVEGWNSGNIEKFMDSYDRSDSLRFVSNGKVNYGWQPVLERYRKRYPDRATMGKLSFTDLDVNVLSRDAAVVFGRFTLQRKDDRPTGLFTLLFRKTAKGWRITLDHTSTPCDG